MNQTLKNLLLDAYETARAMQLGCSEAIEYAANAYANTQEEFDRNLAYLDDAVCLGIY